MLFDTALLAYHALIGLDWIGFYAPTLRVYTHEAWPGAAFIEAAAPPPRCSGWSACTGAPSIVASRIPPAPANPFGCFVLFLAI